MYVSDSSMNDVELELLLVEEELIEHDTRERRIYEEQRIESERRNRDRDDLVFRQNVLKDMKRLGIRLYKA